jgi:hypothetical protein
VGRLREEEWGVSRSLAVAALVAPVAGGVLVGAVAENRRLYRVLVREDGLLEWLQVAAWLVALVAAAVLVRRRRGWQRAAWVLFALACAAAVGEELAWGQRLFDFGTPEALRDADKQKEATLHNVRAFESPTRWAVIVVASVGAVAPWVTRRLPRFLVTAFAIAAAYELARLPAGERVDYRFAKYAEWPELCFAAALAGFVVCSGRRVESGPCQTS